MQTKENLKFLIIDDKQLILNLATRMLKANGYKNFVTASNGLGGLAKLKKRGINFVITDWDMPKMTGIEVLRSLRNDPEHYNMSILIVSEEMSKEKILFALEEGVDACLSKPFSETELISSINEVLQAKLNPDPMKYKLQRLYSLKAQKKYDKAVEFAESLLEEGKNVYVYLALGECYLADNQYEEARDSLQEVLKIKKNSKALHLIGKTYMGEAEYEKAIEFFEQAYMANSMNIGAIIDMGNAYLYLGATKEATETFSSLNDTNISDLNCTSIGSAYLSTGDIVNAEKYLQQAQSPVVDTIGVFNKYAIELRKAGRFNEAIEQYHRCLRIDPANHILLLNTALSYTEVKNYKEAETMLEKCLEIDPNYETAKKLLTYVQSKLSKRKK